MTLKLLHVSEVFFHNFYSIFSWSYSLANFSWNQCSMQPSCQLFIVFKSVDFFNFKWLFFYSYKLFDYFEHIPVLVFFFFPVLSFVTFRMSNSPPHVGSCIEMFGHQSVAMFGEVIEPLRDWILLKQVLNRGGGRLWGYITTLPLSISFYFLSG